MSFFERAKAAASDLAAKADVAMTQAGINTPGGAPGSGGGGGERALRDLGVLAYLEATGRPASADDRQRILAALRELESSGRLGPLTLTPPAPPGYGAPGAPPPPPGAAAAAAAPPPPPPPGAAVTPPPPPGDAGSAPPAPSAPSAPPGPEPMPPGSTPPPPPPSWA